MLRTIGELHGFALVGTDDEVGRALDFYFDDEHWTARYLVARTGGWLEGREVLISPIAIRQIDWENTRIFIDLSRDQVEHAPDIDVDQPISRHGTAYHRYFGWAGYWVGAGSGGWGPSAFPGAFARQPWREPPEPEEAIQQKRADPHLRSCREIIGYHLRATDHALGHVDDFVFDEGSWTLRYLVVDTRSWWFGRKALVSTEWVERVRWEERSVLVNLTRDAIRTSPVWDPRMPITRAYEERLHEHYAHPVYWPPPEQARRRPEQPQAEEESPTRPYPTEPDKRPWI